MSDMRLDYNDVSLIRAYATLAKDCEAKVNRLMEPLVEVLENSGIGNGKCGRTQSLFKGGRSDVYRELAPDSFIYVGIGGDPDTGEDFLCTWIETPNKHPQKRAFKGLLQDVADKLRLKNSRWKLPSQEAESGWRAWDDVELLIPLATLLVVDDQVKAVKEFVINAVNDLKEVGVIDALNRTIGNGATGKRK